MAFKKCIKKVDASVFTGKDQTNNSRGSFSPTLQVKQHRQKHHHLLFFLFIIPKVCSSLHNKFYNFKQIFARTIKSKGAHTVDLFVC